MIKKLIVCTVFFYGIANCNTRPAAYNNIDILSPYIWGWFGNANYLLDIINTHRPKIVVELGSWLGTSTAFLAENIGNNGVVYAVDVWEETSECLVALPRTITDPDAFFKNLYHQFLSNMIYLNLDHKVIPIKSTSLLAAQEIDIQVDLVYVDASHAEEDVYNDIKAWYPKLVSGGLMCGDDWQWPTVRAGVMRIAKDLNQTVHYENNFWWFDLKN